MKIYGLETIDPTAGYHQQHIAVMEGLGNIETVGREKVREGLQRKMGFACVWFEDERGDPYYDPVTRWQIAQSN